MSSSDAIIVAPYVGEFGWELMTWQARARFVIRNSPSSRFFVCAAPDRRTLYRDLIDGRRVRFCPMPRFDWPGQANDDHRVLDDKSPMQAGQLSELVRRHTTEVLETLGVDAATCTWMMPTYRSDMWPTTVGKQDFGLIRRDLPIQFDVVLVPRRRAFASDRNLPDAWWRELEQLLAGRGLRVETLKPRMDRAVAQLSAARLAIGASTGGLHLASICGCPHYVWGSGAESRWTRMAMTNRQRYETVWNPLGTPCQYDEIGWQPGVEHVVNAANAALVRIGLTLDGAAPSLRKSARWRVKRGLARVFEKSESRTVWPWRVREVVRKYLV